jgi:hypothetical protein
MEVTTLITSISQLKFFCCAHPLTLRNEMHESIASINENRFPFTIMEMAFNTKTNKQKQHPYMIFSNKQLGVEI